MQVGWDLAAPCSTRTTFTMRNTLPAGLFQHYEGRSAWDLSMADNGFKVLLTHKHNGIQTLRFYFSLKGLMEGLNKLCLSIYLRPWISKHAWANSIAASRSRSKLKTQNPKPKADHSRINNGTHRLSHIFYFHPLHQPKNPVFTKNYLPKSFIFSTRSKILEIFNSKTPNRLEFEKKVPKCPLFLWLLSLQDPLFFALHAHVWEECCSLKHSLQKLENFVFLKQNRAIWWILLGTNLIKVMKTKFQFYRLNRPNCILWMNFIGGQGWYTGHHL